MRLRRIQLVMSTAAVLASAAGCGGAGNKADDSQYVTKCNEKAVTGSHIGRVRCHREVDAAERERRDREFMEKLQHDTARPQSSSGPAPR